MAGNQKKRVKRHTPPSGVYEDMLDRSREEAVVNALYAKYWSSAELVFLAER